MMNRELPNFRAGFAHDLTTDPGAALRTAVDLGVYLYRGVHHGEAIRMLRAALDAAPDAAAIDRVRALNSLTALTYFSGDLPGTADLVNLVADLIPEIPPDVAPRDYAETLFFLAIGGAVTAQTALTTRITDQLIEYCEQHDVAVMIPAALSVRTVALLKAATDDNQRREYADKLQRISRGWNKGWANQVVGELYLRHPELAPDSGERALAALRTALARFLHHEDYPYTLNTLRIGALALARVGRPLDDAARLLSAVRVHADRLGLRTPGLYLPGDPWVEEALGVEPMEVDLSWSAMVALLAD
jgi:hypothetical protein